ncbi:MAG: lysoplasmalogenase [Candidatus Marinimicrobia bacterium]|nr:lysoplasmalogenase [Candidatus Neomarinimicrobiota bacterium]
MLSVCSVAIVLLTITVVLLIRAKFQENRDQIYIYKPLSTALVILIALIPLLFKQNMSVGYSIWIIVALLFSMGGDIALIFQEKAQAFRIGLCFFLITHILYAVTFSIFAGMNQQKLPIIIVLGILAAICYMYLYPGLGSMKISVLLYILTITYMFNRAIATQFSPNFSNRQAWLITIGAGLFYISDLILAINRFRTSFKYNRISLAFYYSGQLLIALSTVSW